jgi:hypothetical protein
LLSWRHVAVAAAIASPWYVRNALETGNAFFLGSQTSGFSSTIAAHLAVSAPSIFSAMRNYGGLLALLGVPAVVLLSRQKTSARTLAPYLPYLAAANLVLWLFIPNSATTRPGELNQILSGWSIRYAIFGLALLSVAGIVWLSRLNEKFAVAVATVVVLATSIREFRFALHVDPGAIAFAVPCAAAIVAAGLAFAARSTARLVATGLTACVVFAVAGSIGAERIAASWNDRYQGTAVLGSRYALGPAIDLATVREARRVGAIETPPLPLVGPHFERYVVADENGLPVDAWWRTIQIARPQAVVASALRSGGLSPNELRLRSSGLYRIVYAGPSLRVYVPVSGHGSLVAALKIER